MAVRKKKTQVVTPEMLALQLQAIDQRLSALEHAVGDRQDNNPHRDKFNLEDRVHYLECIVRELRAGRRPDDLLDDLLR